MLRLPIEETLIHRVWSSLWQQTWEYCSHCPTLAGMVFLALVALLSGCTAPRQTAETATIELSPRPDLMRQTQAEADRKSAGCLSCHTTLDAPTMHLSPAVHLGCTDCHGGDAKTHVPGGMLAGSALYQQAKQQAHVQPRFPHAWPTSANPARSYTLLNRETPEFIRFVNPGDLRVAQETCGGCHAAEVRQASTSLMTTSAVFWTAAAYNNGIVPFKQARFGESYRRNGVAQKLEASSAPTPADLLKGVLPWLLPLPRWEVVKPGDNFRVFEDGGVLIPSLFPDIGNPNPLEEAGKPDIRQSNRGLGTGLRISVPVLNLHKTRLNDPHLSFLGTNDHPGDYRSGGCTACHVIYANDRDPYHSGPYAGYGHLGRSHTTDPTIPKDESGHPIQHRFTRAIPSSQCMVCHMHQPNAFLNTYLGYQMWDYETDGEAMWPAQQRSPSTEEIWHSLDHNPEEAATRGLWSDAAFLARVWELNPRLKHTQFADYHGHGWNFYAVLKRNKKGQLLDALGQEIPFAEVTPAKLQRAMRETTEQPEARRGIPVHLKDIHTEKGMHCVDCHFAQDNHGNGNLYGEYTNAIEVSCVDCHGSIERRATLRTSGAAAPADGHDLTLLRTPWGQRRFTWQGQTLVQRSMLTPGLEWEVAQVLDSITPGTAHYNEKARLAKTLQKDGITWGSVPADPARLAHSAERVECYTCHLSWTTSCAGCHLPVQANWKKAMQHFEGDLSRNWASYNPQATRTDQFILGLHGSVKGGKVAPVRSSSALVLSSTNTNRERLYIQQPPMSSAGFSSQAFNPHFPHTVRTTETKTCTDCHISVQNNNNAWLQSVLGQGTNFVNFIGRHAWVAEGPAGFEAVTVTEWDEPQAVLGSYLHKLAYPTNYQQHKERQEQLQVAYHHSGTNVLQVQLRGEYLYTANGPGGLRVYDVASVDNKGFSERLVTAPVSPLGQQTVVPSTYATAVALPTTMPVDPTRCYRDTGQVVLPTRPLPATPCQPENQEQRPHELYRYVYVTDRVEGLIVVNVDTLADRNPRNNFLRRAVT
ncbi:MAG TPA: multiheme c-type cytochrome, partial [Candidatus Tectomicrobia bacterium]